LHRQHHIPERDPSDAAILNEAWSTEHGAFDLALIIAYLTIQT